MKKLLLILLCFSILSCNSNIENDTKQEVKDHSIVQDSIVISKKTVKDSLDKHNSIVLDFPSISTFADSVIYLGCEDIISITPPSFNFEIYEDTIIDLHQFDDRLNIKLKFNWLFEKSWDIGVTSIDIIKKGKAISNINLKEIVKVEAFPQKSPETGRYMEPVQEDIYMQDVNLDSYLDIKVRSECGKACYYSYWIFNPIKNEFERDDSLDAMRPYYYDCKNNFIYSYPGGTGWYYDIIAYKVANGKIKRYQSVYYEFNEKYNLEIYRDSDDNILLSDTTYNN
ncbi:MAG: hypothetical protein H8E55_41770 [Pelagibacterales bacterium]|nr:hypothetical protein [Pelagibacterales bacterium]